MKKITLSLLAVSSACFVGVGHAGSMGPINDAPTNWTGFYIGANAGAWWSTSSSINTRGVPRYDHHHMGARNIADALASVGTNDFSINSNGFIGGGQVGYNVQYAENVVVGIDVGMDGLTQSKNSVRKNKTVNLIDYPNESYTSSISVNKRFDYLGTLRGRLGYLVNPTLLVYGAGGLAYAGVSFNTSFTTNHSLGSPTYSPIRMQNNRQDTRAGWTAGGGLEWMFRSNWSAKIEGIYYDLGTVNNNAVLSQKSSLPNPEAVWGTARVNAATKFTTGAILVGLNYHC